MSAPIFCALYSYASIMSTTIIFDAPKAFAHPTAQHPIGPHPVISNYFPFTLILSSAL